jgi:hypothetical protein
MMRDCESLEPAGLNRARKSPRPATEASPLPDKLPGVMTFFTVYSITEIAYGFPSLGRMAMAPLIAHV